MKTLINFLILLVFNFSLSFGQKKKKVTKNSDTSSIVYNDLKWRNIGPFRGGRSVASTGVVNAVSTFYMGSTGGGVWKTQDNGMHWKNISDGFF